MELPSSLGPPSTSPSEAKPQVSPAVTLPQVTAEQKAALAQLAALQKNMRAMISAGTAQGQVMIDTVVGRLPVRLQLPVERGDVLLLQIMTSPSGQPTARLLSINNQTVAPPLPVAPQAAQPAATAVATPDPARLLTAALSTAGAVPATVMVPADSPEALPAGTTMLVRLLTGSTPTASPAPGAPAPSTPASSGQPATPAPAASPAPAGQAPSPPGVPVQTPVAAAAPPTPPTAGTALPTPAMPAPATAATPQQGPGAPIPASGMPQAPLAAPMPPAAPAGLPPTTLPAPAPAAAAPVPAAAAPLPAPPPAEGGDEPRMVLPGVVATNSHLGRPLVQTSMGLLSLDMPRTLPGGAPVILEIIGLPTPPPVTTVLAAPALRPLAGVAFPALFQALEVLRAAAPVVAEQLTARLPQKGPEGAAALIAVAAAARSGGSARSWLGEEPAEALNRLGHGELAQRLGQELDSLASQVRRPAGPEWQTSTLPFWTGHELIPVRLVTRREQDEAERKAKTETGTRFIVEVEMSRLGPIQLDGLIRKANKQFDIIVRTRAPLDQEMRQDIQDIFFRALDGIGMKGQAIFQAGGNFVPVPKDDAKPASAVGTGVMA